MDKFRRVLVLGGNGFIGSHLVEALLKNGHQVRSFDRPGSALPASIAALPGLQVVEGDFSNEADMAAAASGCDLCFHLISTTLPKSSNADPVFDIESNLGGTVRFLNQAVRCGMKKVVFVSSGGTVYGRTVQLPVNEDHPTDPISSYGITKLAIEKYLALYQQLHGLDYSVLRLSNPYGERQRPEGSQGVIAVFLAKVMKGETLEIWGDGSVVRDYIHISDVVQALLAAAARQTDERVLNIGSGQGTSLNDVIDVIGRVTGQEVSRTYLQARSFDVPASVLAIERARRALGWSPEVSLFDGVRRTAEWIAASQRRR